MTVYLHNNNLVTVKPVFTSMIRICSSHISIFEMKLIYFRFVIQDDRKFCTQREVDVDFFISSLTSLSCTGTITDKKGVLQKCICVNPDSLKLLQKNRSIIIIHQQQKNPQKTGQFPLAQR